MSATDYIMGGLVLLVLAAASPFIYEQATADVPRVDGQYWLERGYDPLPENSLPPVGEEKEGGAR